MTKTIFKYPMGIATTHEMPEGAEFLDVQMQDQNIIAWFMVLADNKRVPRKFHIYGTGQEIPMDKCYLGTVQDGLLVWHLFEDFKLGDA